MAARLTELGADLDAVDAEGRTALHLAAGCGDRTMVLQLVDLGADVNARDSVGGAWLSFRCELCLFASYMPTSSVPVAL